MTENAAARIARQPSAFAKLYRHVLYGDYTNTAKVVAAAIADHQGRQVIDDTPAWPSIAHLAALLGCSQRTVARALSELEAGSAITIDRRPGRSSFYWANPTPDTRVISPPRNTKTRDAGDLTDTSSASDRTVPNVSQRRTNKKIQEEDGSEALSMIKGPTESWSDVLTRLSNQGHL